MARKTYNNTLLKLKFSMVRLDVLVE